MMARINGNPQQKMCGAIVAIIPSFTALFFIVVLFVVNAIINIFRNIIKQINIDNIPVCGITSCVNTKNKFCVPADYAFQDQAPVYLFTNENISGYLDRLSDMNGARVLTVASSGDHVFEAYLSGASHVDAFDINSYQRNILELKTHMIRALPYSDFMDFFFDKKNFFNQQILAPITSDFSRELTYFMQKCSVASNGMFRYNNSTAPDYELRHIRYICDSALYYRLREILTDKIKFHHCKIDRVSAKFKQDYDLIMLSNIFDYMYHDVPTKELRFSKYYNNILCPLASKNLNDNGRICFAYMWGTKPAAWSNFTDFMQREYAKNKTHTFLSRSVVSAFQDMDWDTVLIMQKRQR